MSSSLLPLTSAQLGVWNAQSLNPESPYYVVGEVLQLGPGHIELETLQHSIRELQQEAETLRVRITLDGSTPLQSVVQETSGVYSVIDVRGAVDPQRSAEAWVDALRAECAETMRSMVDQPLCRYSIILLDATTTWVLQLYHHLIVDGFSASLLTRRLGQIYSARVAGTQARPFRAVPLSELVALDQEYRESVEHVRDTQYWSTVLAELPEDIDRAALNTSTKADGAGQTTITTTVRLEPEVMEILTANATAEQITWVELMIALYGAFIHRLCSPRAVSEQFLAVPVMARSHISELRTPAMAVNVLPLRIRVDNQQTVREYLSHAVEALRGLLAHQRLRGESLPQIMGDSRVADLLHGVGVNAKAFTTRANFAGVPGRLRNVAGGPPEDMGLVLTPADDGGLDMAFETDPARVGTELSRARLEALREFTCQALRNPSRIIGEIGLHNRSRCEEMLEQRCALSSNQVEKDGSQDALGAALVTLRRRTQAHLVVHSADGWDVERGSATQDSEVRGDEVLDGESLHTAVHRLARYFRREVLGSAQWHQKEYGVTQGGARPVLALELERGSELVIAVLAAFTAGVPFVVIDPGSPSQRREQIYANAEPVACVTAVEIHHALDADSNDQAGTATESHGDPETCPGAEELAYLVYTSGSTGQPKGVEVPRRAISALFSQHCSGLYDRPHSVVAHTASFSFDAAFDQLLWLLAGHDVHLYPQQASSDADQLVQHFALQQISVVDTTPSMMKALLAARLLEKVPSLQLVVLGGEELPADLWDYLATTDLEVFNAYGPTECTVDALLARVEPGMAHLGRPIPGVRAYLVDNALQLVGDGDVGELVLAGSQLALGYRGLPEATATAFVEDVCIDPRRAPERIYRTGDRARWVPGRGYQFLGRIDEQVEINGQRVELAEVEAALSTLNGVRDCAVAPLRRSEQTLVLVAAVVADSSTIALDSEAMRRQLQATLPAAVIPRCIHLLRALPTTSSGKIDREAIAAYGLESQATGAREQTVASDGAETTETPGTANAIASDTTNPLAALSPAHRLLHRTVCQVLDLPPQQADPHQDFISLGGESIAALQVASQARQQGLVLQPKDLLDGTALAQISVSVKALQSEDATVDTPSETLTHMGAEVPHHGDNQRLEWGELPWSPVARMQIAAAPTVHAMRRHVMYRWLDVPAGRERADVLRVVEVLQRRHASLRMLLDWDNAAQLIPRVPLVSAADIVVELAPGCPDPVEQLAARIAPDRGVMWQVGLRDGSALVMVHHLGIDALSWQNLLREWDGAMIDATVKLPALNGVLRAHGFWQARAYRTSEHVLPKVSEHRLCPRGEATVVWRAVTMADAAAMSPGIARRFRARRQAVVVALVARALQAVGLGDYQLVVERHGRDGGAVDCSALIGWFTTEEYWDFSGEADSLPDSSRGGSPSSMAAWVLAAREAERRAQPWGQVEGFAQRRVVVNVLDAQPKESFGVLESDERQMAEAMTINVFLYSGRADVEYVADAAALGAASSAKVEELHEQLQRAAQDLLVADRLALRHALPSDYVFLNKQPANHNQGHGASGQPTPTLSVARLRHLEAIHGSLEDIVPVTPSQQGLLCHALTGTDCYVIAAVVELTGVDDPERVHRAMSAILRRHAALRAVFDISDQPLMIIPERITLPWEVHDCRDLSSAASHALVEQLRDARAHRTVNLEHGPLVTADLVLLPEDNHSANNQPAALVLGSHHIVTDGWSTAVMLRDTQRLLNGEDLDSAPSFAEFAGALYQRTADELEHERRAWQQMLTVTDYPGRANPAKEFGGIVADLCQVAADKQATTEAPEILHVVYRDTDGRMAAAARSLGTTPSALVSTAWLLTLAALHGGQRVTTGVTLSGRPVDQPRMAHAVGMFITTLPLHLHLDLECTMRQTVRKVAETMRLISENQATPLQDIERLAGSAPLFDTAVVYDHHAHFGVPKGSNADEDPVARTRVQGLRASGRTHYSLTVVCPPGDVLEITLAHRPEVVDRILHSAAVRWFTTFLNTLCDGGGSQDIRLAELLPVHGECEDPGSGRVAVQDTTEADVDSAECPESSPVCAQIQATMEGLLNRPVGPEENFFTCGGDSLLAMRLMGALRKKGLRLKIQEIVDTGTPMAMAEHLARGAGGGMNSQRQQNPDRPRRHPLWCIHPIGGHGLAFTPLVNLLSRTSFDTRLIELPSPLPQVESLAELVELYTAQILAEQQQDPFALVGYSFGGMVAEGIAAALQRRGLNVQFLGILDAYPSGLARSAGMPAPLHAPSKDRTVTCDYNVQALVRADGVSHEMDTVGVDIENNIRFCMGLLHTAEPTDYEGSVNLVVATRNNDDTVRRQWNPAGAWQRHPGVQQVRVSELELTHEQLVQEDGWSQILQQWAPILLGEDSVEQPDHVSTRNRSAHVLDPANGKD